MTNNRFPTPQLDFAFRVLIDRLILLSDAAQPGELLTIFDDGSGGGLQGTHPVIEVSNDRILLSIQGSPVSFRHWDLHYPFDVTQWTERQKQVIDQLVEKHQQTFILATLSGFIGCQGFPEYPAQANLLCAQYPGKIVWRSSATAAAEDLRAVGMTQTLYEIVVWMNSEVVLAAIPDCPPIWRATGKMLSARKTSIPS